MYRFALRLFICRTEESDIAKAQPDRQGNANGGMRSNSILDEDEYDEDREFEMVCISLSLFFCLSLSL
jgi:hypothetical protein